MWETNRTEPRVQGVLCDLWLLLLLFLLMLAWREREWGRVFAAGMDAADRGGWESTEIDEAPPEVSSEQPLTAHAGPSLLWPAEPS